MKLVSIAIPCYEMNGRGVEFLNFSFEKIYEQTYKEIQVVISDHSIDEGIKDLCDQWKEKLNIKYVKNDKNRGSSSSNINNAIDHSDGEIIKILFQDDYLYGENSIDDIVINFNEDTLWLITACNHTKDTIKFENVHYPYFHDNIHLGFNTISSPSVLTINKSVTERFSEDLIWLMDCDMYKKLHIRYGLPTIVNNINVVNRLWGNRLSDTIPNSVKNNEYKIMKDKYKQ
jgi:hypothetical protein